MPERATHVAVAFDGTGWHPAACHHLNPGVASTSPAVALALTAAATSAIRIGSGAVQLGHHRPVHGRGVRPHRRAAPRPGSHPSSCWPHPGSPSQVAGQLEQLRDATVADELIITTTTHDHADRVRSYELLAGEWSQR
jgi:alkanesulfonate monooxygenase SsuD/methylene tetrahydromethanopterin reductase-like flavin-dependent oxidoreductase (luciferase family)